MNVILKKTGTHLFQKHLDQYTPPDPLYEQYTNDKGKKKKRKRVAPPGLSRRDERILTSIQTRAHYLDRTFRILWMRFGWTFILGFFFPVVGPAIDLVLSYTLIVRKAKKADLPAWLFNRMVLNNLIGTGISLLPFIGGLAMAIYKPNSRNAKLFEEFMRVRGDEFIKLRGSSELIEEDKKEGWWKALVRRAKSSDVSPKDAEQVKPGAGMTMEEIRHVPTPMSEAGPSTSGSAVAVDRSDPGESKKKKLNGSGFHLFGNSKSKRVVENTPKVGDSGRFVENLEMPSP